MNESGGLACKMTKTTREKAFGEKYVSSKRIEYTVMMMGGACASALVTSALMSLKPPSVDTTSVALNRPWSKDFFVRSSVLLLVQSIVFTITGAINNPTLK